MLGHAGPCWTTFDQAGPGCAMLDHIGPGRTMLDQALESLLSSSWFDLPALSSPLLSLLHKGNQNISMLKWECFDIFPDHQSGSRRTVCRFECGDGFSQWIEGPGLCRSRTVRSRRDSSPIMHCFSSEPWSTPTGFRQETLHLSGCSAVWLAASRTRMWCEPIRTKAQKIEPINTNKTGNRGDGAGDANAVLVGETLLIGWIFSAVINTSPINLKRPAFSWWLEKWVQTAQEAAETSKVKESDTTSSDLWPVRNSLQFLASHVDFIQKQGWPDDIDRR